MSEKCVKNKKLITISALIVFVMVVIFIIYKIAIINPVDSNVVKVNNISVSLCKDSSYHVLKMTGNSIYDFQILSDDKAVLSGKIKAYNECNDIVKQYENSNKDNIDHFKLKDMDCTIINQDASNVFNMVSMRSESMGQGFIGYSSENMDTIKDVLKQIIMH